MKNLFALFLLTGLPAFAQSPPVAANADPVKANSQQAKQVIDKCIAALGGDLYLNIKDYEHVGRGFGFVHNEPGGVGTPYWRFHRYPDKDRIEVTKKRDIIGIHNGDKGWEVTFRGTKPEPDKAHDAYLRRQRYALDYVLRGWIHQPGVALFYEDTTIVGPRTAYQVTIVNAQNERVTLLIDVNTYLPIKKTYSWRDPQYKDMNTEEEDYDQYRPEQGIQTPHVMSLVYNGETVSQAFLKEVRYNVGFPDDLFTPKTFTYDKMKK